MKMECLRHMTSMVLVILGIMILCLLASSSAFLMSRFDEDGEESVDKRGSRDLAFFQMYRLCDRDRNGHFTHAELQCLNQMLHMILLGVRS